ncbi:MAG: SIS domain-containing protein [Proteobacteria bacterium]|nr:SIS domain-containing protein [Pseudomonadota bacterium]
MTEREFDLVGVGSIVVDRIARTARIIGPEEKIALLNDPGCSPFGDYVGGVTLNHLAWAALLGLRTAMVGRAADDADGAFARAGMERLGIEHRLSLDGSATALSLIFVDPAGERAIYMSRGANAENDGPCIDAVHRPWLGDSAIVSTEISQIPLSGVVAVLRAGRAAGATTVLDVDIPVADALASLGSEAELEEALSLADVLKPASGVLAGLVPAGTPLAMAAALRARTGARVVAVTDGAAGCAIDAEGFSQTLPAAAVGEVVDSTGAGDAFLGGFIAAIARGLPWGDAGRLANACGAACCEIVGAVPRGADSRTRVEVLAGPAITTLLAHPDDDADESADAAAPSAARAFLRTAAAELAGLEEGIADEEVAAAVELTAARLAAGGRVHVSGVGKPGHAAHYLAALLASTGTPATYLDALETTHGSAGQVVQGDVVIAISNSGGTRELLAAAAAVRAMGAAVIAVTARPDSPLGQVADAVLPAPVGSEGGPLGLAPRVSVLAQIAVVAAFSCELQARAGFDRSDYHLRHPAGALGKASS